MKKEILSVCIIFIIIVIIDIISQKYLDNAVEKTDAQLEKLAEISENCLDENEENSQENDKSNNKQNEEHNKNSNLKEQVEDVNNEWKIYKDTLSLYVEHDELEKVDTAIVLLSTLIDVENYEEAIPKIKECMFILDHIKTKQKISISNLL